MLKPEIEKKMEKITKDYKNACREYNREYRLLDEVLYGLCRKHPGHSRKDEINAKVWIIGRTYATGIERGIPTNNRQGGAMSKLADLFYKNRLTRKPIAALLSKVQKIREPLSLCKLKTIIEIHGELTAMLSKIALNGQSTRSFVSKYMHFHCRAVPLYDSFAAAAVPKFVRWHENLCVVDRPASPDELYFRYAMRFWHLYKRLREEKAQVKVKLLDYYLLREGQKVVNSRRRKRTRKKG